MVNRYKVSICDNGVWCDLHTVTTTSSRRAMELAAVGLSIDAADRPLVHTPVKGRMIYDFENIALCVERLPKK